jgi:large repetitive protein
VNIANGGSTTSSTVIVDFQGTVAGKGSEIDIKVDKKPWKAVASPYKIPGLSDGPHTICLKAVNQAGKADPTPAQWRFIVINDDD